MTDDCDRYISLEEARAKTDVKQRATKEDVEQAIQRLSQLPLAEYELVRKEEANRLGFRSATLDHLVKRERDDDVDYSSGTGLELIEPKPWNVSVDGEALLDGVVGGITRYVALPIESAHAVALWVVFTHAFDFFSATR